MAHSRAYLASDHILLVDLSDFRETYRRCYLRDIQAISFRPTIAGRVINAVIAVPVILSLVAGLMSPGDNLVPAGVIGGLFLLVLLVNTAMGPTCSCSIRTPVQTLRVGSVGRMHSLRRFLARVQPLIDAAQRMPSTAPDDPPSTAFTPSAASSAGESPAVSDSAPPGGTTPAPGGG